MQIGHRQRVWAADPAGARQMIAGMMPGLHASRTLSALAAAPVSSLSCPLLSSYAQSHPELVALAMGEGPAPVLFPGAGGSGGLPKATASGIDPGLLARLPWQCRRPLAAEPDRAKVLAGIELYSDRTYDADMAAMDYGRDPANEAYTDAMEDWLTGAQTSALGPPNARERVSYAAAPGTYRAGDEDDEPAEKDWERWPGAAAARHRAVSAAAATPAADLSNAQIYERLFGPEG